MKLLIIDPANFSVLSTFIIAILGFLVSIGTLLLTYMMAKTAIQALDTWKNQKHYDIYLDAISFLPSLNGDFYDKVSKINTLLSNEVDNISYDTLNKLVTHRKDLINILDKHNYFTIKAKIDLLPLDNVDYNQVRDKYTNIRDFFNAYTSEVSILQIWHSQGTQFNDAIFKNKIRVLALNTNNHFMNFITNGGWS